MSGRAAPHRDCRAAHEQIARVLHTSHRGNDHLLDVGCAYGISDQQEDSDSPDGGPKLMKGARKNTFKTLRFQVTAYTATLFVGLRPTIASVCHHGQSHQ